MGFYEHLTAGPLGSERRPRGNMFRNIPNAEADATVETAWAEDFLILLLSTERSWKTAKARSEQSLEERQERCPRLRRAALYP